MSAFLWSKITEQEKERGAAQTKVNTPGKIPAWLTMTYKGCLPSSNISLKKDFDTDVLLTNVVTHVQVLSVTFIEYGQNVNKHH